MAGFKWSLDWDTNPLRRGGQQAADAIEDAVEVFEDMAKAADKATEKAGDGLADDVKAGGRTAERALSDLEDAFRATAREAETKSRKVGDDLGDEVKKGSKRAEQATSEFKDEAGANFSEVASSFSGDMDSAVDLVQGTLGGLANTIPGIGIAAGAAAAGIGLVYSTLSEQAEATKQRISAMTEALASGAVESFITDELSKIFTGADDAAISMSNLREAVEETGVAQSTLARAWAGDETARVEALEKISAAYTAAQDKASSTDMRTRQQGEAAVAELGRWKDALEDMGEGYDTATTNAQGLASAIRDIPSSTNTDVNVNTEPGRMGLGDFRRDLTTPQTVRLDVDTTALDQELAKTRTLRVNVMARTGSPAAV